MKLKSVIITIFFIFAVPNLCFAEQEGVFLLNISPGVNVPFPVTVSEKLDDYYTIGGGVSLTGEYILPAVPFFIAGGGLSYSIAPSNTDVTNSSIPVNYLSLIGKAGLIFEPLPSLSIGLNLIPGYYLLFLEGKTGSGFAFGAEANVYYGFTKNFSLGLNADYKNYWSMSAGGPAYHGLGINLGARISFGGEEDSKLDIKESGFFPIFPVFYRYYDDNALGEITVQNNEQGTIRDVVISFYINQYMDKPKTCKVFRELKPGEEAVVPLYALFTDNVLGITEGTKVMAQILTEYRYQDQKYLKEHIESIEIQNRNAMTWDDDRKAASFITAKDPTVLMYSKGIASSIRNLGTAEVNANFRSALGIFESLSLYGINYVIDPTTPYEELSQNQTVVDFLQFPSQTLIYKAGDCDDLSILMCAVLEAVGIETALVTVPGHIFMAFALHMEPSEAEKTFLNPEDLILTETDTWIPVEITMINEGFLKAWQTGAKEWRENQVKDAVAFYPVHDAWTVYKPVGIISGEINIDMPEMEKVEATYNDVLETFIEREINPRVEALRAKIVSSGNNPNYINRLGVLYARFGLFAKAKQEFERMLMQQENISALINLGNLYFIEKDFDSAQTYYQRAYAVNEQSTKALLSMAKVNFELENYNEVWLYYEQLKIQSPETAEKYAYLVSSTQESNRAGLSWIRETAVWDGDEE